MGIFNSQHTIYYPFILLTLVRLTNQDFVGIVEQNFDERVNNILQQLVLTYHNLEFAYKSYASYFDRADVDLPGFKKFFRHLEEHALKNAIATTTYINKRGGTISFPPAKLKDACNYIEKLEDSNVEPQICNFLSRDQKKKDFKNNWKSKTGVHALDEALALEKHVNSELLKLVDDTNKHNDPHTRITIETLIEHQVNTIKEVADLNQKLQITAHGDYLLAEYLLDRDLE